ncbi:MAG: hypothetical protein U1F83_04800 [Verrucomicrobiota bacterium]
MLKFSLLIVFLAVFAGFTPRAEASWLSDAGRKVVNTVVDAGRKVVDTVKPVLDKTETVIGGFVEPALDYVKSGNWKELLGLIGTIIGGGGTAGPDDTGGGGGGGSGEVAAAVIRPSYGENQIDNLNVSTKINGVSVLNPGATIRVNVTEMTGTKAGTVAIKQEAAGFTADLGTGSMLEVNGVHVLGVQGTALSFEQKAKGEYWRLTPNTAARLNIIEMLGGRYGTVGLVQELDMPRLEVQGGTTELNMFRSR